MLCDNLLEEGERTRIARICTDFLLNRLNLCEVVWGVKGEVGGAIVCIDFFWGRGEGVLEAVGVCLYICGQ